LGARLELADAAERQGGREEQLGALAKERGAAKAARVQQLQR
jgi:hypothetical protein